MKKQILQAVFTLLFFIMAGVMANGYAQGTPPPPPGGGHGATGNQPPTGGSAPIGSGVAIMLALGAAWAGKKVYEERSSKN